VCHWGHPTRATARHTCGERGAPRGAPPPLRQKNALRFALCDTDASRTPRPMPPRRINDDSDSDDFISDDDARRKGGKKAKVKDKSKEARVSARAGCGGSCGGCFQ
jgi:hypothetical protein